MIRVEELPGEASQTRARAPVARSLAPRAQEKWLTRDLFFKHESTSLPRRMCRPDAANGRDPLRSPTGVGTASTARRGWQATCGWEPHVIDQDVVLMA
jgi:hypothetical protein